MKAFLSHSSKDKEFVRAVAQDLGRQFSVFDEASFGSAIEFRESIRIGIEQSDLFVLFVSRDALTSKWVTHEIDEAWYAKTLGSLRRVLVYLLDDGIQVAELPEWMRRAKITSAYSPQLVIREIRDHLGQLLEERQHPVFLGRNRESGQLEAMLTPIDETPPRAFVVSGLPGIGRRSLLRHVIPGLLDLRRTIQIEIGEGDTIQDICIQVAATVEPFTTVAGLQRLVEEIGALSDGDALERLLTDIRTLIRFGDLPTFIDAGGIIGDDGRLTTAFQAVIQGVSPRDQAYLGIIATRRPQGLDDLNLPILFLESLGKEPTTRLLKVLGDRKGLNFLGSQLRELAEYTAGYPPAAYFAVEQCQRYGVDVALADQGALTSFRTAEFVRHFSRVALNDADRLILSILAVYSPLPFKVIQDLVGLSAVDVADRLIHLIDLNFLVTNEHHEYLIAAPIVDASIRAFGYPPKEQSRKVARILAAFAETADATSSLLSLSRSVFRAALLGGESELATQAIHLANDLIRLTETLYHAKRYAEVIEMARVALTRRPDSTSARAFLIRALAYEERWSEAEEELREYQAHGQPKEMAFLQGFVARKGGRFRDAIQYYQQAVRLGRGGASVNRELASCFFQLADYDNAAKYIERGLRHNRGNKYLLDLAIQVATFRGDDARARELLRELRQVESPMWYHHRASRLELSQGNLPQALKEAVLATERAKEPPFEVLAQLAHTQLASGLSDDAEQTIEILENRFSSIRHDIRIGLRARLAIQRREYRAAVALTEQFRRKDQSVHRATRLRALEALLEHVRLGDDDREVVKREIALLREQLGRVNYDLIPFD